MKFRVSTGLLLIGLLSKGISGIGGHYNLLNEFGRGFFDGIAIVFLVVGLLLFGFNTGMLIMKRRIE